MAKMIIAGEELQMPVWLKARLLVSTIETTDDANVLTVESGTNRNKRHFVRHDGTVALSCSCPAIGTCAHKQAVNSYLEQAQVEETGEMEAIAEQIIAAEAIANFFAFLADYGNEQRRLYWRNEATKAANTAAFTRATTTVKHEQCAAVVEAERHLAEERRRKAPMTSNDNFSILK